MITKNQCNNNNNNEIFLMLMICSILFATIISTTYATQQQGQKFTEIIPTTIGPIRGLKYENKNVFLGIPFGESTAGENRWKNPIPKTKSNVIFNATKLGKPCPGYNSGNQKWVEFLNLTESEDCLNLNVWTPSSSSKDSNNNNNQIGL